MRNDGYHAFPWLTALSDVERRRIESVLRPVHFAAGDRPFRIGAPCEAYIRILDGSVRVQMIGENGREIVLYRIGAGEACILTTACLLSRETYPADAVCDTAVTGIALPSADFFDLLARSEAFRDDVFATFGRRIARLLTLIEETIFRRLNVRLAQLLADRAQHDDQIVVTHRSLAAELGSSREVVSRLLKEFERYGWVRLGRGSIIVTAPEALRTFAQSREL
ncbi:MAG: Crp/Fnr family transcriptional regulator [Rhodospirillales bacterium]|nr:Crp/Fnr family transcriptional regulator [Rhodospirillales bacterium]